VISENDIGNENEGEFDLSLIRCWNEIEILHSEGSFLPEK
jgi:hypothetical protein